MDLKNNKILIKYICGLLGSKEFMRIVRSKGELGNDFIVSILNYSIATREVPDEAFYNAIKEAKSSKDYMDTTAELIYKKLGEKIKANGFNPKPVSIYRDFANNFYRNGLLFSAKKEVEHKVNFPKEFLDLIYEQPNNAIVKAYRYSKNTGRFTYFAPCPQTAISFASDLSGFWGAMLNYKKVNIKNIRDVKQELYDEVAGLDLDNGKKSKLYREIETSLNDYTSATNIRLLITDRDNAYSWQTCKMNGDDYNQNYGEVEPYLDFYSVVKRYKASGLDEKDIVLAEIKQLFYPMTLYARETTPRAEQVSEVVTFNPTSKTKEENLNKIYGIFM